MGTPFLTGTVLAFLQGIDPFILKGQTWEKAMSKYLLALIVMAGSFSAFADSKEAAIDDSNRSSAGERYNEDTASTAASSTMRAEQTPAESTVSTAMPDMTRESLSANKWHAGVTSGISSPERDEISNSAAFGLDVGYQPTENFGLGLDAFTTRQDDAFEEQRTTGLFNAKYVIGGDIPVINKTYIGAGAGPIFVSNKVRWAGAPMLGFDVPLSSKTSDYLSLGANAKYIFTTDNADAPRELASALALKYWF